MPHFPKTFISSLIRLLVAFGALKIDFAKYGALAISDIANKIYEGNTPFEAKKIVVGKEKVKSKASIVREEVKIENQDLLQILKNLRLDLATENKVPAYVIFPDRTLYQIANTKPTTREDFLNISGVGEKKLEEYFKPFSKTITDFLATE